MDAEERARAQEEAAAAAAASEAAAREAAAKEATARAAAGEMEARIKAETALQRRAAKPSTAPAWNSPRAVPVAKPAPVLEETDYMKDRRWRQLRLIRVVASAPRKVATKFIASTKLAPASPARVAPRLPRSPSPGPLYDTVSAWVHPTASSASLAAVATAITAAASPSAAIAAATAVEVPLLLA